MGLTLLRICVIIALYYFGLPNYYGFHNHIIAVFVEFVKYYQKNSKKKGK